MLVFGATGDMVSRLLLPGIGELLRDGLAPDDLRIVGTARTELSDDEWRAEIADGIAQHAPHLPDDVRTDLLTRLSYVQSDVGNADQIMHAIDRASEGKAHPVVVYIALPQGLFDQTIFAIGQAGLPEGSRIAVEKPFGENEEDARKLNALLREVVGGCEDAVFRVDHVLGDWATHNIVDMRAMNPHLEVIWNSQFVERIDILWEEQLALEGRASFYDRAGALKDVMQNHMVQVLCSVAMELPSAEHDVSARRLALLEAIAPISADEVATRTRRARYTAGRMGERDIPAYVDEDGVDPERMTETLAEVELRIDNERWRGTSVVMRAAKGMSYTKVGALVTFRTAETAAPKSRLWIAVDLKSGIDWTFAARQPLDPGQPHSVLLSTGPLEEARSAYANVALGVLSGADAASVSGAEAEAAWRVFDPVLAAWAENQVPMEEYPAGTVGPAS